MHMYILGTNLKWSLYCTSWPVKRKAVRFTIPAISLLSNVQQFLVESLSKMNKEQLQHTTLENKSSQKNISGQYIFFIFPIQLDD